jgi:hypothetical protein
MVIQENWWCPPEEYQDIQDDWFIHFFEEGCRQFSDVSSDSIYVYTVFGNQQYPDPLQVENNVNFLFIGENTVIHQDHPFYYSMDAILTFFHDSPKSIRLPLWMIYWNFYKDGLFTIPSSSTFSTTEKTHRKNKAIIVISHDNNEIRRQICSKVIQELGILIDSNFDQVPHDMKIDIPRRGTKHKRLLLQNYRYNICAENSYNPGYVTEKIFESLSCGCFPIYWGHIPVEPEILHRDAYMNVFDTNDPSKSKGNLTNVWKEDAIVHIFATYLKVWSIVYKKKGLSKLRNSCHFVIYPVCSKDECYDILKNHWKMYQQLWKPRPHFRLLDIASGEILQEIFMEDLADEMYAQYKTNY